MRWMNEEHKMKHLTNLKWDQVNVPTIERMVQQAVTRGATRDEEEELR
jgi:hypothetical protein